MERKACTTILRRGLDKGSILLPSLFKLYIDEALTEISANEIGCRLGFIYELTSWHMLMTWFLLPTMKLI